MRQLTMTRHALNSSRSSADAAKASADAASLQAAAAMAGERAWISLKFQKPGFVKPTAGTSLACVKVTVKNHGKTPAHVTNIHIGMMIREHGDPLPIDFSVPDDPTRRHTSGHLFADDTPLYEERYFTFKDPDKSSVENSEKRLWIYAWVDYIDAFGRRHRFFKGRLYEPILGDGENAGGMNLMRPEGLYEIDRPRTSNEGRDWPQTQQET